MSLLKKIESEVGQGDKALLDILDVAKSTGEMLVQLQSAGKISLETNLPDNEDQGPN